MPDVMPRRSTTQNGTPNGKPPIPPRRRLPSSVNVGVGKLLGMASNALGKASGSGNVTPTKQNGSGLATSTKEGRASAPPPLPKRSDVRAVRREAGKKSEDDEASDVGKEDKAEPVDTTDKVMELRLQLDALTKQEGLVPGAFIFYSNVSSF